MSSSSSTLLPGDVVPQSVLPNPQSTSKALTLGPGLHYTPPSAINAVNVGHLSSDARKNAVWLESTGKGHYVPTQGDLVIATVHHSSTDFYHCSLSPHTALATLPQLAFENANKKTRPTLQSGSLVYARVTVASRHVEPEIECVYASTGKADGLGELKGGMVWDISPGLARRLLAGKQKADAALVVLDEFGNAGWKFEVAVGRNGKVWVNGEDLKTTIAVGRALQEVDEKGMTVQEQMKLVKKLLKSG